MKVSQTQSPTFFPFDVLNSHLSKDFCEPALSTALSHDDYAVSCDFFTADPRAFGRHFLKRSVVCFFCILLKLLLVSGAYRQKKINI